MAKEKILDIIPEALHEQLIGEVKDLLQQQGYKLTPGSTGGVSTQSVDADIKEWADKNTKDQESFNPKQ